MVAISAFDGLVTDLESLAGALEALTFPPGPTDAPASAERERLVRTVRSYLLPRLEGPPSPLLVVFAGPTGAGKSTIVNSLSGRERARTGLLRPTTDRPVVIAAEPGRYTSIGGVECHTVQGKAPILASATLVDTPDIDSTSLEHRRMAEALIDCADIVLFVTSGLRYADLVPWEVLRRALSRGAPVIPVLNRVSVETNAAITDFNRLLGEHGIHAAPVVVHEHRLEPGAFAVPSVAVRAVRRAIVTRVDQQRRDAGNAYRSVLWATVGAARDLVANAELAATEGDLVAGMIDQAFTLDLDRALDAVPPLDGISGIDPGELERLAAAPRLRRKRRLRRVAPGAGEVARRRRSLADAIVASVLTDLRVTISRGEIEIDDRPVTIVGMGTETRARLESAVGGWLGGIEERIGAASGRPDLGALLLAACVARPSEPARRALHAVAPDIDPDVTVDEAVRDLYERLAAIYEVVGSTVRTLTLDGFSSMTSVDRARSAVAGVVARSAFANA